jgi:hypothetical protein
MTHLPALLALVFASAAAAGPLKSREEISVPLSADDEFCYDKPEITEAQKAGYKLVFVHSIMRWKEHDVCTERWAGSHLAVHEQLDEGYRTLKRMALEEVRLSPVLVSAHMAGNPSQSPEGLLTIEQYYPGTGNFIGYDVYRLSHDGDLQPVPIKPADSLLQDRLRDGQYIVGPSYDFVDDRIGFGMSIANRGESNRFPSGGSAAGTMKLVAAKAGLELVPEPQSLQLSSE